MNTYQAKAIIEAIAVVLVIVYLCFLSYIAFSCIQDNTMQQEFCQQPNIYAYNDGKTYCNGSEYVCNYKLKKCHYVLYGVNE